MEWRNVLKRKEEIFSLLFPNCIITVFDNETSGLNNKAKIIQFAAIKYKLNSDLSFTKVDEINLYINPEEKLKPKITELTGITDEMLENCPTEKSLCEKIFSFLENSDVIAAYNKAFDLRMLDLMSDRTKCLFDTPPSVDILEMARDLIPNDKVENHKLGTITNYMFPDNTIHFHSAIEDVEATGMVMELFLKGYWQYAKKYGEGQNKNPIHLEEGHLFINKHKGSQQRLIMVLNKGNPGDIYYDIVKKTWSCKVSSSAKELFNNIDLLDLEEQFLKRYAYRFGLHTMDDVAKRWMAFKREQNKKRKTKELSEKVKEIS